MHISHPVDHQRSRNPYGVAALGFGVLLVVVSAVNLALAPTMPFFHTYYGVPFRSWLLVSEIPPAIIATAATALGIIGLLLRGRPRMTAAIGTTLGATYLIIGLAGAFGSVVLAPAIATLEF